MYELIKKIGRAKRGRLTTVHGVIETPVFMNVGTAAAIKGAVAAEDLEQIGTQVELSNTYHLHVRPGDELIKSLGGLHRFMNWHKPILTDSGGFQVFSLAGLRKIKEEGVRFHSHVDGKLIFMGPEESMRIQSNLGSTIAMAFDECANSRSERAYIEQSVARTTRWLVRCREEMARLNSLPDTINPHQLRPHASGIRRRTAMTARMQRRRIHANLHFLQFEDFAIKLHALRTGMGAGGHVLIFGVAVGLHGLPGGLGLHAGQLRHHQPLGVLERPAENLPNLARHVPGALPGDEAGHQLPADLRFQRFLMRPEPF